MPSIIVKRSISITQELQDRLQLLVSKRGREYTESDLIREAIRRYLDEQEDIAGSRRHFAKTFQDRIDRLENVLTFHLNVLIYLVAVGLSITLRAITKEKLTAAQLIQNAIIAARRDAALTAKIAAVRDMPDQSIRE